MFRITTKASLYRYLIPLRSVWSNVIANTSSFNLFYIDSVVITIPACTFSSFCSWFRQLCSLLWLYWSFELIDHFYFLLNSCLLFCRSFAHHPVATSLSFVSPVTRSIIIVSVIYKPSQSAFLNQELNLMLQVNTIFRVMAYIFMKLAVKFGVLLLQ